MPESLEQRFRRIAPKLKTIAASLEDAVRDSLKDTVHIDRISFRAKELGSFLTKAAKVNGLGLPKYRQPFEEIEDMIAGRVIVFFPSDIEPVLTRLGRLFRTVEAQHKAPARDEEFGYESFHRVYHLTSAMRPSGSEYVDLPRTFELQVRTLMMHAYAEPQHDINYKSVNELPSEIRRELAWIAASAWGADQAYERVAEWNRKANQNLDNAIGEV